MSNARLTEAEIRDEIARAEALDARLALQLDDLAARRVEIENERRKAARRAEGLRADLRDKLEEPRLALEFAAAADRLRARIARANRPADRYSSTLATVKEDLAKLEGDMTSSSAAKLRSLDTLNLRFQDRLILDQRGWDANTRPLSH